MKPSHYAFLFVIFSSIVGSQANAKTVCVETNETAFAGPGKCPSAALRGAKIFAKHPSLQKLCKVSRRTKLTKKWTAISGKRSKGVCVSKWRVCAKCPS